MRLFKNRSKKILAFIVLVLIGSFIFLKTYALEVRWPSSPMGSVLTDDSTLTDVVKYFYEWGISIGGIAAFFALLFGGFLYLTSAGDPARLREAKDRIISAFTGLVILLGSWLILNTINPELTVLRTPEATVPTTTLEAALSALEFYPCDYVTFYAEPNYASTSHQVDLGHEEEVNFKILSLRLFDAKGTPCEESASSCSCLVKFYEVHQFWFFHWCSGTLYWSTAASNSDLMDVDLPAPVCVSVEKIPYLQH